MEPGERDEAEEQRQQQQENADGALLNHRQTLCHHGIDLVRHVSLFWD